MRPKSELQPGISRKEIPAVRHALKRTHNCPTWHCWRKKSSFLLWSVRWQVTVNLSNLLLLMRRSGRPLPIGLWAKKSRVLMFQSDGLHFMLMHSNHASLMSPSWQCLVLCFLRTLLPLFPDDSKYVAMIRYSMDVVQRAVHLNHHNTPIFGAFGCAYGLKESALAIVSHQILLVKIVRYYLLFP